MENVVVPNCEYDSCYVAPLAFCEWHWHLWFACGDESLAKEELERNRKIDKDWNSGHQIKF